MSNAWIAPTGSDAPPARRAARKARAPSSEGAPGSARPFSGNATHAVSQDNTFVTVTIEEKTQFVGTSRLMMMFGAKDLQLRQWTVTDPQGFDTTVAVYNLDATKKPDPRMFVINYDNNSQRVQ